ncbi:methyl-accepting chemotaxis protein [Cereibacter azotoformans]|uniref:methyl-accepting chemotaxis protein n=1 Tax=Cereibacter azotoformans TaxID=43057 RepID=UPI001EEAA7B9|nr:methyl-accepting chemotaxis protein [Cereibacter azotoformans]ULB09938.1 methyl-accepting chemotaxis protein [Cereibacter azotoformans]
MKSTDMLHRERMSPSVVLLLGAVLPLAMGGAIALHLADKQVSLLSARNAETIAQVVANEGRAALAFRDGRRLTMLFETTANAIAKPGLIGIAMDSEGRPIVHSSSEIPDVLHDLATEAMASQRMITDGSVVAIPAQRDGDGSPIGVIALSLPPSVDWRDFYPSLIILLCSLVIFTGTLTFVWQRLRARHVALENLLKQACASGNDPAMLRHLGQEHPLQGKHLLALAASIQNTRERMASLQLHASALEALDVPWLLADQKNTISACNATASRLAERDAETLVGQTLSVVDARLLELTASEKSKSTLLQIAGRPTAAHFKSVADTGYKIVVLIDQSRSAHLEYLLKAIKTSMTCAEYDDNDILVNASTDFKQLFGSSTSSIASLVGDSVTASHLIERVHLEKSTRHKFEQDMTGGDTKDITLKMISIPDGGLLVFADTITLVKEARPIDLSNLVEFLRLVFSQLAEGNLSCRFNEPLPEPLDRLRTYLNGAIGGLASLIDDAVSSAESIRDEAHDISSAAQSLAQRTESTAATLEQTAAALDSLTLSVRAAAEGAAEADRVVSDAKANAEQSGHVVIETVAAMDTIATSSDKITSIVKVIDDIAFQTNLLALNAGVEAARAGDAGRGFAVVASEVRALAQRSSEAAREITDLILKSGSQVKRGVDLVGKTGQALQEIVSSVSEISDLVSDIAVSSRRQSASLAEINSAVNNLDQSTQQNAARLEEATAASESLTHSAVLLLDAMRRFKTETSNTTSVQTGALTRRPPPRAAGALARSMDAENGWEDF